MQTTAECKNLLECALFWEKAEPDRMCFTQPMGGGDLNIKTWTWKEAVREARKMASYLQSLDLPERSGIALCSKNCAYWLIADLSIWMAGHVSVPIYPMLTEEMVKFTIEHSESKLLFVGKLDPVWDDMKKGVPPGIKTVAFPLAPENDYEKWDDIIEKHEPLTELAKCPSSETATIIYTSGSTGTPKGAMISFEAMYRSGKGLSDFLKSHPEDRSISYLPLAHCAERFVIQSQSLYAGFPLFFAESPETFLDDLKRARPTLFLSVPRLWVKFQLGVFKKVPPNKLDKLLKIPIINGIIKKKILKQLGLDHVRIAASGAAPISKDLIEWYRNLGLELLEGYGMTENFAYSHLNWPGAVRPGYVGNPYPEVQHKISDEGEILVKSPGNMKGYFKMPDENKNVFTNDGFLRTGDLGEIDESDRLKITGRAKELFKTSKGKYVAPALIENLLSNSPVVEACFVSGNGYHQPYCVLMLSEEARETVKKGGKQLLSEKLTHLLEDVNQMLAPFEQLAFIAIANDVWSTENGFLTPTLKIKRQVLDDTYGPLADGWYKTKESVVWQAVN